MGGRSYLVAVFGYIWMINPVGGLVAIATGKAGFATPTSSRLSCDHLGPWQDGGMSDPGWARSALATLRAERDAEPETPWVTYPGLDLHFKDESCHPSGSLKHPVVRAMFEQAIASGWIHEKSTIVEASAGNAAVAGAFFARLLELSFVTVVPGKTGAAQVRRIESLGGQCHRFDPPAAIYDEARRVAAEVNGYYLDHFRHATDAVDWRRSPLAAALVQRDPQWIVVGAGTGATSATIGRYLRYHGHNARLAVVDPENSAYFPGWVTGIDDYTTGMPSRIEGIGRPRVEPGFLPDVIDLMIPVPDEQSRESRDRFAAQTGIDAGASTGANLAGALRLVEMMHERGETGTIVSLIADRRLA
jgi:cysteine synthase A